MSKGQHIASNRGLNDRITHIGAPAREILLEFDCAGIRTETYKAVGSFLRRETENLRQRSSRPVAQSQPLEAPGQTFPRTGGDSQRRRTGSYHVDGNVTAACAIPLALEPCRPIDEMMDFIQQQDRCAVLGARLCLRPAALPETRKRRVWLVTSGLHCSVTKLLGDFEEQRSFADLPRASEELDTAGGLFLETVEQKLAAGGESVIDLSHNRIIIRLQPETC